MKKWQTGCGALAAIALVVVAGVGWWVYDVTRSHKIAIRNEGGSVVRVWAEPTDLCEGADIAVGAVIAYKDDWLCRKPRLKFRSPTIGHVECDWNSAADFDAVVIQDDSVSCYPGIILTPLPAPPFFPPRNPTSTPVR
jgi:hypothetical protein